MTIHYNAYSRILLVVHTCDKNRVICVRSYLCGCLYRYSSWCEQTLRPEENCVVWKRSDVILNFACTCLFLQSTSSFVTPLLCGSHKSYSAILQPFLKKRSVLFHAFLLSFLFHYGSTPVLILYMEVFCKGMHSCVLLCFVWFLFSNALFYHYRNIIHCFKVFLKNS